MRSNSKLVQSCVFIVLAALAMVSVQAQSTNGSVYNVFGIGGLNDLGLVTYGSMGGTAIGTRSLYNVNLKNPAALTSVLGPNQIFDVDVKYSGIKQWNDLESQNTSVGGLANINLWFRTSNRFAFTLGTNKFSNSKYNIIDNQQLSDLVSNYTVHHTGDGGLSQIYLGAGFDLGKFSVGVKPSIIFGRISQVQNIENNVYLGDIEITQKQFVSKGIFDLGIQYALLLGDQKRLVIGAIYRPEFLLEGEVESKIVRSSSSVDSLTVITNDEVTLPRKLGAGLSFETYSWTFAADYEVDQWSVNGEGTDFRYLDKHQWSVGVEYIKDRKSHNYVERLHWRAGAKYSNYYIAIKKQKLTDFTTSFGVGLPVNRGKGYVNLGYSYRGFGTNSSQLIREATNTFSLNISVRDIWFVKRAYD